MQRPHNDRRRSGPVSSSFGDGSNLRRSPSTTLLRQSQAIVATIATNAHADSAYPSRPARANSFSAQPIPIEPSAHLPRYEQHRAARIRETNARVMEANRYTRNAGNGELSRPSGATLYYEDEEDLAASSPDSDCSFTIPVRDVRPLVTSPGRRPRLNFSDLARTHEERERPREYEPLYPVFRPSTVLALSPARNAIPSRGTGSAPRGGGGALRTTIGFDVPGAPPPRPPSPSRNPLGAGSYGPYATRGGGWGSAGTSAMRSSGGRAASPGRTGGLSQVGRSLSDGAATHSRPPASFGTPPPPRLFRGGRDDWN